MSLKKNSQKALPEIQGKDLAIDLRPKADALTVSLSGRLTVMSPQEIWRPLEDIIKKGRPSTLRELTFDLSQLSWTDLGGLSQLFDLRNRLAKIDINISFIGMSANIKELFTLADEALKHAPTPPSPPKTGAIEELGAGAYVFLEDAKDIITYMGDVTAKLGEILINPARLRLRATLVVAETAGVNALPIVMVISFLLGLVLAFQAAVPMRMFGAEVFVADLIAISVTRELGPLMTAIVLAGRSGSAFAAELGAMKAGQEIDALVTMGLDPVRFLVVGRVVASVIVTPMLSLMANFVGLIGGSIVLLALNYPPMVYWQRVVDALVMTDVLTGLFKAGVFGLIVAAIGCQRGLAVAGGPESVGVATTKSVVTNIVLIAVFDSIFAVTFYVLGI